MMRWEYQTAILHQDVVDIEMLNELGSDGWELVSVLQAGEGYAAKGLFKRPIVNNQWPTGDGFSTNAELSFPLDPDKRKKLSF